MVLKTEMLAPVAVLFDVVTTVMCESPANSRVVTTQVPLRAPLLGVFSAWEQGH
jgi:hypothetical protein